MACQPSSVKFQLRRAIASNWTSTNPILKAGEPGFETDTYKLKIGDGINTWKNLPYSGKSAVGPTGAVQYTDGIGNFLGDSGFLYNPVANNVILSGDFLPNLDGKYSLGTPQNRWSEINVGRGTINIGGPSGTTAVGLIGTDGNAIVYTSFGFATPFINIGPEQGITLTQGNIGGWVIGPTGVAFSSEYDLIAQEKLVGAAFPAGLTGPRYSLIKNISPETISDVYGSRGTTGQVLSSNGTTLRWTSVIGVTGSQGIQGVTGTFTLPSVTHVHPTSTTTTSYTIDLTNVTAGSRFYARWDGAITSLIFSTPTSPILPTNFYVYFKNNSNHDINVYHYPGGVGSLTNQYQINDGNSTLRNSVVHKLSGSQSNPFLYVYWNGTNLILV